MLFIISITFSFSISFSLALALGLPLAKPLGFLFSAFGLPPFKPLFRLVSMKLERFSISISRRSLYKSPFSSCLNFSIH